MCVTLTVYFFVGKGEGYLYLKAAIDGSCERITLHTDNCSMNRESSVVANNGEI